ncbi:MAG: PmoA family protein [Phycisphaerae bacterium]|nr:PmoA family protein [Phycisphaerae bacterium]
MRSRLSPTRLNVAVTFTVIAAACLTGYASPADTLQITADDAMITVHEADRRIACYRYDGTSFKPYIKELYTPAGINVLLDSPADHVHHHALMFALEINGTDFWGETQTPACGTQRHVALTKTRIGRGKDSRFARFAQTLGWLAPDDAGPLITEERIICLDRLEGEEVTLLTWSTKLRPAPGRTTLKVDGRHYFGLGMRFVRPMDRTGTFSNADNLPGEVFRGDERLVRSRWCAYSAEIDGKPVTVAMFDAPANPRPAVFFTMKDPFAYLAATLNLHEKSLTLNRGDSLDLAYGVAVWDGKVEAVRIETIYRKWLALLAGHAANAK